MQATAPPAARRARNVRAAPSAPSGATCAATASPASRVLAWPPSPSPPSLRRSAASVVPGTALHAGRSAADRLPGNRWPRRQKRTSRHMQDARIKALQRLDGHLVQGGHRWWHSQCALEESRNQFVVKLDCSMPAALYKVWDVWFGPELAAQLEPPWRSVLSFHGPLLAGR